MEVGVLLLFIAFLLTTSEYDILIGFTSATILVFLLLLLTCAVLEVGDLMIGDDDSLEAPLFSLIMTVVPKVEGWVLTWSTSVGIEIFSGDVVDEELAEGKVLLLF